MAKAVLALTFARQCMKGIMNQRGQKFDVLVSGSCDNDRFTVSSASAPEVASAIMLLILFMVCTHAASRTTTICQCINVTHQRSSRHDSSAWQKFRQATRQLMHQGKLK